MKRIALRLGRLAAALASAGVLLFSCGESQLAAQPPAVATPGAVVVLETICYHPTDAELGSPVRARLQDGTVVDLWCGSRLEVSGGVCRVRVSGQVAEVPCVTPPAAATAVRRPSGPPAG